MAADLIRAFDEPESLIINDIVDLARKLARQHLEQWIAEDMCRSVDGTNLAVTKQAIDIMNARRSVIIEQIDERVFQSISPAVDAPLHTETFGSVVDRLAIAWVRARRLGESRNTPDRARRALRQMVELAEAYDCLVRELGDGHRRVPDWKPLKSYGGSV